MKELAFWGFEHCLLFSGACYQATTTDTKRFAFRQLPRTAEADYWSSGSVGLSG